MLSERVDSARLNELAKSGAALTLRLPVAALVRLSACTLQSGSVGSAAEPEELVADVRFDVGPAGFSRVGFSVTGRVHLQCQRCLEPMAWNVRIEARLSVLDSDQQTGLIASPFDSVLMTVDGLSLAAVIEDEILAAMPMAPIHEDESRCRPATGQDRNLEMEAELTQRPFADLASLVGGRKSDGTD